MVIRILLCSIINIQQNYNQRIDNKMSIRLRQKDLNCNIFDKSKEEQKVYLRILQQCKQIPKMDRLQIRDLIKKNNADLINMFKNHKKNNLQNLQINLRKFLNKLKIEKQNQIINDFKQQLYKDINKRKNMLLEYQQPVKHTDSSQNKFKICKTQQKNRDYRYLAKSNNTSPNKLEGINKKRPTCQQLTRNLQQHYQSTKNQISIRKKLDNSYRSVRNSTKSQLSSNRYNQSTRENRNLDFKPPTFKNYTEIFTDPKILEQCRGIIKKNSNSRLTTYNSIQSNQISNQKDPFTIFNGKYAEQTMQIFFLPAQTRINKDTFRFRMHEFIKRNSFSFSLNDKLDYYFQLLSENSDNLTITQLGKKLDQYGIIQINEVRNLFTFLDKNRKGFLRKDQLKQQRWQNLFNKANYQNKNSIGYWQIFIIRNGWEYFDFVQWYFNQNL